MWEPCATPVFVFTWEVSLFAFLLPRGGATQLSEQRILLFLTFVHDVTTR